MKTAFFRFYEELNDFLPEQKRKTRFEHSFIDRASVKDMIESLGVPHTEIDLILVNGKSVDFSYIVNDGDDISVYPVFESFDIIDVQHLRPEPLRDPKFVLDVHLGKLSRYLRMLGFDCIYKNNLSDADIVLISLNEKRAVLTRDRNILKRKDVTHAYRIRSEDVFEQTLEIIKRFHLEKTIKEFSRCIECNSLIKRIGKEKVLDKIPPNVKEYQNEFYYCMNCDKVYWKGSHYDKMLAFVKRIKEFINPPDKG
jgi:uncharacterized protein